MARGSSSSPKWKGVDPEHFREQDGPHVAGVQDLHRNPDHESVRRIVVRWHIPAIEQVSRVASGQCGRDLHRSYAQSPPALTRLPRKGSAGGLLPRSLRTLAEVPSHRGQLTLGRQALRDHSSVGPEPPRRATRARAPCQESVYAWRERRGRTWSPTSCMPRRHLAPY